MLFYTINQFSQTVVMMFFFLYLQELLLNYVYLILLQEICKEVFGKLLEVPFLVGTGAMAAIKDFKFYHDIGI